MSNCSIHDLHVDASLAGMDNADFQFSTIARSKRCEQEGEK